MEKQEFLELLSAHHSQISAIERCACRIHSDVNQKYDGDLPYGFHLRLAASYLTKYGYLELEDSSELETLYAGVYFHDSMEDARMTYNDVISTFEELNRNYGCDIHVVDAAEMVYALTNDKGRTRSERAGEAYYAGIRNTPHAPFLKMCDRLANVRYTTLMYVGHHMAHVYKREMPHFLESITQGAKTGVPQVMIEELTGLL